MTGPSGAGSRRRILRRLLIDTSPLREHRDYRLLWSGQVVTGMGNQITRIALPYQVFVLTHSVAAVGVLTLVQLVPILAFSLGAGSVADAVDRRRLLVATQLGMAASSLALVWLALQPVPPLAALLAVAFVAAGIGSVDQPARSSSIPRLVSPERLPAAIALNQLSFQAALIVGPAVGGLLIATVGLPGAYAVDVATFAGSLTALAMIGPLAPLATATRPGLAAIREGLVFAMRRRVILSTFAIDLAAMIFGMPMALFPALAIDVFGTGAVGVGLMAAAPGFGAFAGALVSGWVSRVERPGRATAWAVVAWGVAIVGFGLATFSFLLALLFLAIAGAADMLSAVFRATIVQLETPDELRGRVTSIHMLVVTSGPRLGDMEAAAVGALAGPQFAVVSGGLLCIAGVAWVVRFFPELAAHVLPSRRNPAAAGEATP
jgi:MFS family permease